MNTNLILQTLKTIKKGQFFKFSFTSDVPLTAQAKREGFVVYKRTEMTARWGIRYSNIASVKNKMQLKAEMGEYVPESHELTWGTWVSGYEGTLIEHKGTKYLRIYTSPNRSKIQFFVNGQPISRSGLISLNIIQNSYWKKKDEVPECLTIKVENIESIG